VKFAADNMVPFSNTFWLKAGFDDLIDEEIMDRLDPEYRYKKLRRQIKANQPPIYDFPTWGK